MMKKWNEKYKNMFVGNRLLVFTVIPQPNVMTEMSDCEKMEILIKFARLLQRTDDEAACEIRAIKDILEDKE